LSPRDMAANKPHREWLVGSGTHPRSKWQPAKGDFVVRRLSAASKLRRLIKQTSFALRASASSGSFWRTGDTRKCSLVIQNRPAKGCCSERIVCFLLPMPPPPSLVPPEFMTKSLAKEDGEIIVNAQPRELTLRDDAQGLLILRMILGDKLLEPGK
jgi:hypothetical protein